jgi:hypothetical protein
MKKFAILIVLNLMMVSLPVFSIHKGIQYGLTLGATGNHSYFVGGSEQANAGFYSNVYGSGAINFTARYFLSEKWSLQSGLGFTSVGFETGMAKNYSLLKNDHFITARQEVNMGQIPFLVIYSFKPDCKNKNWFLGAGFNFLFSSSKNNETLFPAQPGEEINLLPTVTNYSVDLSVQKKNTPAFQFMAGREKKFNKGNRLSLAFVWNIGLVGTMSTSTVNYTAENTNFQHIFSNRGDFAGLYFTYTFSSKQSRKTSEILKQN